ncbi:MAG: nucleoside 2-deoxyribosyltransferase [Candidatus Freyarchaeota archaeon]|nr:nucleoside 2-deoxyribosyltransferase [Candidatus Freyrarchaeum guaymaensis]HDO80374.1 hypothetical protein [Candidatus Bathyarchaeota archaeon]
MTVKVYFAAPMRGARTGSHIYRLICRFLEEQGCTIITPHVLEDDFEKVEGFMDDEEIFKRDASLLDECDVLVAEVSSPSTGVGVEIGLARCKGKPVLCLYRKEEKSRVSALILGDPDIMKVEYTLDNFYEELRGAIERLKTRKK